MTADARDAFARYLRQRQELGEKELILPGPWLEALRASAAVDDEDVAARTDRKSAPAAPRSPGVAETGLRPPVADERPSAGRRPGQEIQRAPEPVVVSPPPLVQLGSLDSLKAEASVCTACGLASTRTTVVFGEGDPHARLVVVGEAPGADEDRAGRPFVGRAGKLLDLLLASVGFPRESVYICNVLKCRPPANRNPLPEEVRSCERFLHGQLGAISPRAILAVGTFPAQALLGTTEPIGRLRGTVHEYNGIPLVPTYHPAALLRNSAWIRPVWDDLQRLRGVIDR